MGVLPLAVEAGDPEELAEALQGLRTEDWILAAAVFLGALLVSRVVKAVTARVVERDEGAGAARAAQLVGRVVGGVVVVAGFVYALQVLGVRLAPLLGALGLGGLALAFAAQAILSNIFASVLLQARRPFRSGDQISTNDIEGTVEEVNLRTVVLRTYAGERVLVPCAQVLGAPIFNFTANKARRTTVEVGVAYDTDLATAQRVLLAAVRSVEGVQGKPAPEAWVETFGESSIDFAVRFWHAPDIATLWRVRSAVAMAVKSNLDDAGIEIPFPQRTIGFLPDARARVDGGDGDGDTERS
ncbi:MAG: mechanosensitive ion channel family protein [Actinomycetota bacterium]|nr:mechanosensitive ion channel family protein [Actinomycetota bacterium]